MVSGRSCCFNIYNCTALETDEGGAFSISVKILPPLYTVTFPVDSEIADLVVSQTSLHEWEDGQAGCAEIHRILKPGGFVALEDLNRACARWKRTLFVFLTGLGTDLEITRERLRAYETAFTPEEVEKLLEHSGFEIIKSEAGLYLFVLGAKR